MLYLLSGPSLTSIYNCWKNQWFLTIWTFVGKVMSLLFNVLSRFVIAYLPRSKRLLIWWLQSPSAAILETKKMKSITVSTFSTCICHEVMGWDAMILFVCVFNAEFQAGFFTLLFCPHQVALEFFFTFCHLVVQSYCASLPGLPCPSRAPASLVLMCLLGCVIYRLLSP